MIRRRSTRFLLFYILLLVLSQPSSLAARQIQGQNNDLRITAVDAAAFPTVSVRLMTTTAGGGPIPDLTRLILRENGVPIPEATTARVPVGVDVALVIDANSDLLLFDDNSGLSRRDKLAAGIARYAQQFMNPAGLDRVSIITPDEAAEGAAFLVEDAARPSDVVAAIEAYAPTPPRVTPLQAMLDAALGHLAAIEDGRFQAILLYTDGARLNQQLDYAALVEAARQARVPIYVAIIGSVASEDEVANVSALSEPANGRHIHTPEPEAADPIYAIFQAQGQQPLMSYVSELRQNGTHEVSVSIGNVRDTAEFELSLAAPELTIETPQTAVRRAGSAVDTPLELLQPTVLPLTVRVTWPDGRPRALSDVAFHVDGVPQRLATALSPDESGQIAIPWDISDRDAGDYRLEVAIVDELGFQATAAPLQVSIEVARPVPPTPTPVPTRVPLAERGRSLAGDALPGLAALVGLAALAAVALLLRRRRRPAPAAAEPEIPRIEPAAGPPDDRHVAVLSLPRGDAAEEQIELTVPDVTFGREAGMVDIVIDDPGVSRLHARIRRAPNGEYWLYDEGSVQGTFLNYERLGLAPRRLQHNDVIQLGRVTLRFRLELPRPNYGAPAQEDE